MKVKSGQLWQKKGEAVTWRVVSVSKTAIALSGPGPCRSLVSVTPAPLNEEWEFPAVSDAVFQLTEKLSTYDAFRYVGIGKTDAGADLLYVYSKQGKKFPKNVVPSEVEADGRKFSVEIKGIGDVRPA